MELIRTGTKRVSHVLETKNVSSSGILFTDPTDRLEVGQPIEYMISLPTGRQIGEVRLRCMGKIVRRDDDQQALAATLERYEFVRRASASA